MAGPGSNSFRASLLPQEQRTLLVDRKIRRINNGAEGLGAVAVPRSEGRRANHRSGDRHRLGGESATVRHKRRKVEVGLINLSGGGAMIEGPLQAKLWDRLDLVLGEFGRIECIVRWKRGDRFGLEFAHETRIDCDDETRDEMLRQVIRKSFPEVSGALTPEPVLAEGEDEPVQKRAEARHPLIWSGVLHHDYDWQTARIRNISSGGAMVECESEVQTGATVYLDIGDAGRMAATVCWARGDQIGLGFVESFDVSRLASRTPELTPGTWAKPDYLKDESTETSPWASEWGRLTLPELRNTLRR